MLDRSLSDHGLLTGLLVGVHDIGHIEHDVLSQPVVDNHVLLSVGLCTGGLDQSQDFVTSVSDDVAVESNTQSVSVQEVLDHTGDLVIGDITGTNVLQGNVGQNQHFAQDTQLVSGIIVLQEEGGLCAQQVSVSCPVAQVLLVQVQDGALLLFGQSNGLAFSIQDLDGVQFCFEGDDCGIILVDVSQVSVHQRRSCEAGGRQIDGSLLFSSGGTGLNGGLGLCFLLAGSSKDSHGSHAQNQSQNQHHAKEALCGLFHRFDFLPINFLFWGLAYAGNVLSPAYPWCGRISQAGKTCKHCNTSCNLSSS